MTNDLDVVHLFSFVVNLHNTRDSASSGTSASASSNTVVRARGASRI